MAIAPLPSCGEIKFERLRRKVKASYTYILMAPLGSEQEKSFDQYPLDEFQPKFRNDKILPDSTSAGFSSNVTSRSDSDFKNYTEEVSCRRV